MDAKALHIVVRARDTFLTYGIRSVSMDDIAREQGISKKTLYQYYANKGDLVKKMLDFSYSEFENHIAAIEDLKLNAIDDLLELSKIIDDHLKTINPSFSFDLQKYYPDLFRENIEKKRAFAFRYIQNNLEKGIREGMYRNDLDLQTISKLYIQKLEDLHDPSYHGTDRMTFNEVFKVMFESHIRGISNEKGIRYFEEKVKILNIES